MRRRMGASLSKPMTLVDAGEHTVIATCGGHAAYNGEYL
jgi:hypothetical protein